MKLAIFGGSTAAGFGVKSDSFAEQLARRLELEFENHAGPSAQITDSIEWADRAAGAAIVIVMHGAGEALVRPTDRSLRYLPPRWRRRGWMDPRPFYSSSLRKRIPQRIESAIRWRVKVALINATGGQHLTDLETYLELTREFTRQLKAHGAETIVFVGSAGLDDRYFPKSTPQIEIYDDETRAIAEREGALFIEISHTCERWNEYFGDHLHPTVDGHRRLANQIFDALDAAGRLPEAQPASAA
jgi:hypothetical protein